MDNSSITEPITEDNEANELLQLWPVLILEQKIFPEQSLERGLFILGQNESWLAV
jgi:hypothetical protein